MSEKSLGLVENQSVNESLSHYQYHPLSCKRTAENEELTFYIVCFDHPYCICSCICCTHLYTCSKISKASYSPCTKPTYPTCSSCSFFPSTFSCPSAKAIHVQIDCTDKFIVLWNILSAACDLSDFFEYFGQDLIA